eukprot:CAMPEP_0172300542 /NCGR_PEP_ID=MMETSP1058-20130122/2615_1 /TAXON_ID=83371 /ORGANISM="Detonula confervacea, Strain CCMP 353" /LENGTH=65 /DNA_ID=CAMNT_0013010353 /DNA_START=20 /DNA_END=214 /DNA_ORIENTATION=-
MTKGAATLMVKLQMILLDIQAPCRVMVKLLLLEHMGMGMGMVAMREYLCGMALIMTKGAATLTAK